MHALQSKRPILSFHAGVRLGCLSNAGSICAIHLQSHGSEMEQVALFAFSRRDDKMEALSLLLVYLFIYLFMYLFIYL